MIDKIKSLDKLLESYFKPLSNWIKAFKLVTFKKPLLVLSILMILAGAVNNGFTWFLLAIPYLILFLYLIKKFFKKQAIRLITAVSLAVILLGYDHSHNVLLYPYLGSEIQLTDGWGYQRFESSEVHYLKDFTGRLDETSPSYISKQDLFQQPLKLTLSEIHATHPDMVLSLEPIFTTQTGDKLQISESELFKSIKEGRILSKDLDGVTNLQSRWTYWLSALLMWPRLPMMILGLFQVSLDS